MNEFIVILHSANSVVIGAQCLNVYDCGFVRYEKKKISPHRRDDRITVILASKDHLH